MNLSRTDLKALGLALLLVGVVYVHPLFLGRVLIDNPALVDVSFNVIPFLSWVGDAYRLGQFPLWNPHVLCGMPHLAYSHSASLYLVSVFLYSLFPYLYAGSIYIIIHALLASFLFYLILRDLEVLPFLASCASVMLVCSGWILGTLYWSWAIGSLTGILLLWLGFRILSKKSRFSGLLLATLGIAWAGFAGETELLAYGILAIFLMTFLDFGREVSRAQKRVFIILLSVLFGGLILSGIILPTMEMLRFSIRGPLFPEPVKFQSLTDFYLMILPSWFLPLASLKKIIPILAFNSGLSPLYQGFLVPALLLCSLIFDGRDKAQRSLASVLIFFLLLVFFKEFWGISQRILEKIPLLGKMQEPLKSLYFLEAVILAMIFRFLSKIAKGKEKPALKTILAILLGISGASVIGFQKLCLGGPERYLIGGLALGVCLLSIISSRLKPYLSSRSLSLISAGLLLADIYSLALRYVPKTDPQRFELDPGLSEFAHSIKPETRYAIFEELLSENPEAESPIWGLFEVASKAGNILGPQRIPPGRTILYFSQLYRDLFITDLLGRKVFNNWSMSTPGTLDLDRLHLFHLAGTRIVLTRNSPLPRSSPYSLLHPYAFNWQKIGTKFQFDQLQNQLSLNLPSSLEGIFSSLPGDYLKIGLELKEEQPTGFWLNIIRKGSDGLNSQLLFARSFSPGSAPEPLISLSPFSNLPAPLKISFLPLNAETGKLIIKKLEIVNNFRPFQKIARFKSVEVFYNQHALPRAFMVHQPVVISGWEKIANWIKEPENFSPAFQVVLEQRLPEVEIVNRAVKNYEQIKALEKVEIIEYGPNRVEMQAQVVKPGFLVFTDSYFPGWRAYRQNSGVSEELRIMPADLAFRAIFLEPGFHQIQWIYQPKSFEVGLWMSLASLASILILALVKRRQARSHKFLSCAQEISPGAKLKASD